MEQGLIIFLERLFPLRQECKKVWTLFCGDCLFQFDEVAVFGEKMEGISGRFKIRIFIGEHSNFFSCSGFEKSSPLVKPVIFIFAGCQLYV